MIYRFMFSLRAMSMSVWKQRTSADQLKGQPTRRCPSLSAPILAQSELCPHTTAQSGLSMTFTLFRGGHSVSHHDAGHSKSSLNFSLKVDEHGWGLQSLLPDASEPGDLPNGWLEAVQNGVWKKTFYLPNLKPGPHVLKCGMLQTNVLLEKIVVDLGGVRESSLGPPGSTIM